MPETDWTLIEFDPELRRAVFARRAIGPNGEPGTEFKTEYYVDPAIDANKEQANMAAPGWKGDYHHIASISPGLAYGESYIARAMYFNDEKAISKWLNDIDNRGWRTKEGKV